MSLNPSCIETGVYVSIHAKVDPIIETAVQDHRAYVNVEYAVTTLSRNRLDGTGTTPYGVQRVMEHDHARCAPGYICGIPVLIVYNRARVLWYGAAALVTRRGFTDAALNAWRHELFKSLTTKDQEMNFPTPASPFPAAPKAPAAARALYTPAEQLEMAQAAVAAAELAVQEQAAAEHAAAVKAARDAELAHADKIASQQRDIVSEVKRIESGYCPEFRTHWVELRKELAPYVESLGYKFVAAGNGNYLALSKRGAR